MACTRIAGIPEARRDFCLLHNAPSCLNCMSGCMDVCRCWWCSLCQRHHQSGEGCPTEEEEYVPTAAQE